MEKARELMLAAAAATPRVLKDPKPGFLITGFGDNAINLEVRVWINDPQDGIASVKSDIFWGIWKRFRDHGIEIKDLPAPEMEKLMLTHIEVMEDDLRMLASQRALTVKDLLLKS